MEDTLIYWDGYGKPPLIIDTLPAALRNVVLNKIESRKNELSYSDPAFTYIFIGVVFVFFTVVALLSRRKTKKIIQ